MNADTPRGPFHIEVGEDGISRILDRKGRDVMAIEGGPERLLECANALVGVWFPATHVKESESYCERLEKLRKDAWARVQELDQLIAAGGYGQVWNYDMASAPKGERKGKAVKVILLGASGTVTVSRWMHDDERWEMFSKKEAPIAWQAWPTAPIAAQKAA